MSREREREKEHGHEGGWVGTHTVDRGGNIEHRRLREARERAIRRHVSARGGTNNNKNNNNEVDDTVLLGVK